MSTGPTAGPEPEATRGIAIVVPHVRRTKAEDAENEDDDAKGKRVTGFGSGYVFDVSQTDGEPLPTVKVPVLDGEEGQELYDRLTDLTAAEGLTLERRQLRRCLAR